MSTDPEILAAWLQHAYHVNDSHFVAERWRAVADEAIRRLTEAAHRPAEPAPLSDEQIDAIKFGRYITRATAFNADCRAFARAIERAVIAAHQQPQT